MSRITAEDLRKFEREMHEYIGLSPFIPPTPPPSPSRIGAAKDNAHERYEYRIRPFEYGIYTCSLINHHDVDPPRDTDPCPPPTEPTPPPTCRECSSPATHGELCVYCAYSVDYGKTRHGHTRHPFDEAEIYRRMQSVQRYREETARARLAAFDKRNALRSTAESKELAKAHPWEAWSTCGDES